MMRHVRRFGRPSKIVPSDRPTVLFVSIIVVFYDDAVAANGYAEWIKPSLRGVPHILNITVEKVDAEQLMAAMPQLAVSTGSACNSATIEPSHVLHSMGLSRREGLSSLRISLGRMTTSDEVSILIDTLTNAVSQLRSAA